MADLVVLACGQLSPAETWLTISGALAAISLLALALVLVGRWWESHHGGIYVEPPQPPKKRKASNG